jgi:putative phage-type endonuclease
MSIENDRKELVALVLGARLREQAADRHAAQGVRKRRREKEEDEEEEKEEAPELTLGDGWQMDTFEDQLRRGDLSRVSEEMITTHTIGRMGRAPPAVNRITQDMQLAIVQSMMINGPDHIREICSMPQRSEGWFAARVHRLTGSKAGSCIGFNPYETPDKMLCSLLWPSFSTNAAMLNGVAMERPAAVSCLRRIRLDTGDPNVQLAIPGLIVSQEEPMLAYSADGIVLFSDGTRKLIEIKCPFRRKPYLTVPKMYDCQMQLGMHILDLPACYFVVYCGTGVPGRDDETHIQEIPRNRRFTEDVMLPAMRKFFFRRYLPMYVCLKLGMLRHNQCHIPHGVRVDYLNETVWKELKKT